MAVIKCLKEVVNKKDPMPARSGIGSFLSGGSVGWVLGLAAFDKVFHVFFDRVIHGF